jgi:lipopolysaccharide assembly protein A
MRTLVWLARAVVFFILFAFAINNQQETTLKWFFGYESRAPLVFVVLSAFGVGCGMGVFAMVPSWWRQRRQVKRQQKALLASSKLPEVTPVSGATPNPPERADL